MLIYNSIPPKIKNINYKAGKVMENNIIIHPLKPIFDKNSAVLILGTMPSPKSRENNFYYGHPQNRFWRVLSTVFDEKFPENNEERAVLLLKHRIALWDVLASCEIKGAEDSSIKKPVPNDLSIILEACNIKAIFTTGKKAFSLYQKLCEPETKIPAISLPSTSPANCRFTIEDLVEEYNVIKDFLS